MALFQRKRKEPHLLPTYAVPEHWIQAKFAARVRRVNHLAAHLTFAVPNQAIGPSVKKIKYYVAEGVLKGVNDFIVLYPSRGFYCAVIEFKHDHNKLTPEQERFQRNVLAAGGTVRTYWDDVEAYEFWLWYVGITEKR